MEQGNQVVKSPCHHGNLELNTYDNWGSTYKGRGDKKQMKF